MNAFDIKTNLHKLIDSIEDETQLHKVYRAVETLSTVNENGTLWSKLSQEEKNELLDIEKDSHDSDCLVGHEEMKSKHQKWL